MISNCATAFIPLQDAIQHQIYPALLGGPASEIEVQLFDLATCSCWWVGNIGSCGVCIHGLLIFFTKFCNLRAAISGQAEFSPTVHLDKLDTVHCETSAIRGEHIQSTLSTLLTSVSTSTRLC